MDLSDISILADYRRLNLKALSSVINFEVTLCYIWTGVRVQFRTNVESQDVQKSNFDSYEYL